MTTPEPEAPSTKALEKVEAEPDNPEVSDLYQAIQALLAVAPRGFNMEFNTAAVGGKSQQSWEFLVSPEGNQKFTCILKLNGQFQYRNPQPQFLVNILNAIAQRETGSETEAADKVGAEVADTSDAATAVAEAPVRRRRGGRPARRSAPEPVNTEKNLPSCAAIAAACQVELVRIPKRQAAAAEHEAATKAQMGVRVLELGLNNIQAIVIDSKVRVDAAMAEAIDGDGANSAVPLADYETCLSLLEGDVEALEPEDLEFIYAVYRQVITQDPDAYQAHAGVLARAAKSYAGVWGLGPVA